MMGFGMSQNNHIVKVRKNTYLKVLNNAWFLVLRNYEINRLKNAQKTDIEIEIKFSHILYRTRIDMIVTLNPQFIS